jgi:alkylated DNA repair dioxygenase AlkB
MISCPITQLPLENFYKYVFRAIKDRLGNDKTFDVNDFMEKLFEESVKKADPETAAKWLQSTPRVINLIITKSFSDKIPLVKGLENIYGLMADFSKPNGEGFQNVLKKYIKPVDTKDLKGEAAHQLSLEFSDEEEEGPEDEKKETNPRVEARLKTPVVMSGTLQSFVPVDPSRKTDTYSERLDKPRAQILTNLAILGDALSMQDPFDGEFTYQGKKVKVKATNLYTFAQQNFNDLDPTTQQEIKDSNFYTSTGRNKEGVTQSDKRVILVITDDAGQNLYFDTEGNLTTKGNGTLVYQFMRDVRQTSKGYTVTDIYGKEEQLMPIETYAQLTYDEKIDGDYPTYLEKVKDDREKELKRLFQIRESALGNDMMLEFSGLSAGVTSDLTATKLPLSDFLKIPGATKKDLKSIRTLKKAEGNFGEGRAVINLNGTDFQVNRSSMPDSVADQIAAVMFDPNIPFETKKDFYSQFIPEDSTTKLAYTMRKHEIIPDMVNQSFRIKLYDKVGDKYGFVTEPIFDFVISKAVLDKASREKLDAGIKTFSDTLKSGRANGKATYMSYKSDLLNDEEYLVYNSNTKQIEVANYIDFLSTLDGYVDLFDGDPGFYNKHLLFNEENKVEKEIKIASAAASQTFEEALEESIKLAEERKALENADKSPMEIEAQVIADRALSPEFRAQLAQQGMEGKYDTYYYAASLIQAINTNISQRYTREAAEQLRDIFAGARYINGKQINTVTDIINRAFPKAEGPLQREVEIIQKTVEPEMPDPTTINPSPKKGSLRSRAPKNDSLNREGYMADEIGEEDTAKVLDWWNNTALGKELQKHIELQHAFNLVNSDVFARFVVSGATLANPDIKGKIQINKGVGTLVDVYHEAWHGFSQLFLTRQEKYSLYDEVINYKDASGNQPYKSMDYKAVDELLAEDFRTYMKSNYIKKGSPIRNKLFRKIMNFIRSLFGKKAINPTEVITDVMNVPAVRELFEKLNYSSNKKSFVRSYKANMDNVDFMMLNRGISKLNRPSDSALSDQDSRLVSDTMDMIISDFVDDWYRERVEEAEETGNYNSLKSGTIGLLIDPDHRAFMYEVIKERLQDKLDEFKEKLHSQEGVTPFSEIKALESSDPNQKTIESEAVAVLRSNKGEDKYVFLKSQIDGFDNLDANMRRGTRVRGESWHGIKIVGDFYSHKSIKKGKKPVGIIVVSSLEDAQVQFDNYKAGGAEEYTDFEVKDVPDYMLSAEQEFMLDNVRILQAAVDNFGDPQWDIKGIEATGTIAYHLENSDFDLSKKKYELDFDMLDENGDEIDEDQENETHDSETPFGSSAGTKKSLMQLADKEVIYILKSLYKVDRNGNVAYNRLGFKERADFKKVWNIVTKAIGGIRDREKAYETLMAEAENFPEIAQLIETKFPDPRLITNTFEIDVSNSFWQTFAKPSVKYWQFTVFPQYEPGTNFLTGETENVLKGFEADVTQSSIEVDSTIRKFESIFKSSIANDYIEKNSDNQSTLKLDDVITAFENKKYPGQLDTSKAFEFAAALGMKLDALPVIKKNIEDRAEYFGLPYIYDIIKDFAGIQKSNKSTEQQLEYLNKFVSNPIGTLRGEIPKGILKSFKKEVAEKNILKRIAELQSQYGYDSANPGILLPDGNRVFENVNHSQVTVTVDAINNVENLSDFWSKPELGYMSHLRPGKSFFTLRSKIFGAMFDTAQGTFDRKGTRSLELLQTAGTQIAEMEGVNTSDLDKLGKFFQEFHTMSLNGIAEFIRHAEKKSAYGIKLLGGKMKVIVNGITNGVDQNLYIDISKFVTKPNEQISDGEIVAVGGYFLDYIAAEFDRIRYFKQNPQDLKNIKGYNREIKDKNDKLIGRAGEFFTAFDNILRDQTKKDLYALASDPLVDLPTHIRNNQGLYLKIQQDIADYFTEKTEAMYNDYFKDLPYVDNKVYEKAGIETKGDISDESKKAVLKSYLFNDWIHKFEMFNIFNGDLSQFNHDKQQASKRAPGSTSDGDGFVNDKYMHEFINKVFNKNTYAKKLAKETGLDLDKFVMNGTLNTGVIADAERKSVYLDEMLESWKEQYTAALTPLYTDKAALKKEIDRRLAKDAKAYKKMTESDGAAFMTFDAYRTLKKQGKSWTIPQETLYQQIVAGEQVDPLKVKEFFPIYKLHYYGSIANAPIATTGMHKFAVAPIIPTIAVKGTELYNLHVKMMKENLQYVAFGSGSKVATLTMTGDFDNIFGDETQKTVSADAPIRKNVIYLEYLKDVTKVASKLKKEISYPTQKRVLLLDGLFNVGDVINKANAEIANNYKANVKDYTETLALDLLNKIGYEYDPKTEKYVGKLDKFIELIRDELGAKEVPEHLIKLLDTTLSDQLSMDFSIHPEADMLEKVIVNRIQKSIIKQKTKGESMVQAPSTFYNGVWDSAYQRDEAIKNNDELIRKYLGSNNLPFYTRGKLNKDGTRQPTSAMKVAIPMNGDFLNILNLKHPDGELIGTTDRLNELIKNDEWLDKNRELITIVGPRIPTDAANSMEFAEVWHFLDASAGNTVIVPTEIVAKAGSDFDVDKIFFMLPNINSDGTLTKAPAENLEQLTKMVKESNSVSKKVRKEKGLPNPQALIDQYKKAAQNKLIKNTRDILSLPDNYASLTKPNNTYLVEDEVEFYDKYSRGYNNKKNAHGESVRINGDKEVMSPSRSLDNDYNLSQHEAMLSGNMPLGIMAKKNKVHALFKSVGAIMPLSYNATVWNDETKKYDEIPAQYDVVIRMRHNKTMFNENISLSNQNNVDGEKIGDIFSHGLQGLLDRANNPFPFKLQIVKEALGTINHLIEAGVSVPEVFAFINNPWIVDYIQKQMYYGGSMAKLQEAPVPSHQVKSTAFRETVASLVSAGGEEMKKIVKQVANYANDRRMMDIADMLKQKDQDKVYIIKTKDAEGEEVLKKATGKRIFHSNDFPVDQIIELKEFEENTDYDSLKTLFKRSGGIANNDNFYYASEALWNRAFPGSSTVSKDRLQSLVMGGHNPSIENLAILMHMLQLEKQFKGMDELEMAFSPDTGLMDTTLQIKKRDDAFKLFDETSKIDSDFLKRLRNNSILSSFYKSGLIMDLVVPLFPLRLNETISKFVEKKIDQTRDMIVQKFGPGVKGKERFINMYNNAVVNYIFQNTKSNSLDNDGNAVTLPESVHSLPIKEVTTGPAVSFTDKDVKVNLEQARKDFDARIFLSSNNTPEGNRAKNLDTFDAGENPFPTFPTYLKFAIEKEYLTTVYTKESLAKNKDFLKLSFQAGSEDLGYDKYITQTALMNSYNRAFIMGTTKYSYTTMVMDIINEFEDQNIKDNFPVLAQLAPAKFTKDVNVLELNDKATAKGTVADDYYKNLRQLADYTVRKVVNSNKEVQKMDNNRISDVFKNFSMFMYYQHGTGYSKLGFVKVLDPEKFTKIMQNAANSFLNNDLSEETLERIYNRLNAKSQFKNYMIDPSNLNEEESVEDFLSTFSEDDFGDMSDFLEQGPTQPAINVDEFDVADKLTPIEQNFADGQGGRQMQPQFKGKSTMDLIISGDRTRTTRANTDIQRMAKDYNLSKISDLVGKLIRMTDKTGRQVYTRITKVTPFTQEYQDATWQKEGWVKSVTDKHVGNYPYAIEFEVVNKPTQLSTQNQPTEGIPKGQEVVPGVYVNQGALTQDEQMELFDYLKPYLEEQAAKTNKGQNASKMIGLGLRWDYKSNNVGRAAINIPDVINPGNKTKYGYYNVSINDQPLGQITPRFKELMQKATGVDMTNYDGAIINLYENDSFISSHNDVDESKSAIQYPVIGINIGGKGNFSIERIPGAGELSLEAGTGYVFGVDGVNREVWHRTFPTKQDTFLPELTTRIDGKTYPAGSYRVTITMRRVEPLLPEMPIVPAINAEQLPVETVAAGSTVIISEFYNDLTEEHKKILGNLEDLIAEYDEIPFDYSEEKYIESLKCKLS